MKEYTKNGKVLDSKPNLRHRPNNHLHFTRKDVAETLNMATHSNNLS